MEQFLNEVSQFYGVPVWHCVGGMVCAIIVAIILITFVKVKTDFITFLFVVIGVFLSGFKFGAPIALICAIAAIWAVIDGIKEKRSTT